MVELLQQVIALSNRKQSNNELLLKQTENLGNTVAGRASRSIHPCWLSAQAENISNRSDVEGESQGKASHPSAVEVFHLISALYLPDITGDPARRLHTVSLLLLLRAGRSSRGLTELKEH